MQQRIAKIARVQFMATPLCILATDVLLLSLVSEL